MSGIDEARLNRAVRGYMRFRRIKAVVSFSFIVVMILLSIAVASANGLIWGLVVFFVGSPIAGGVLGLIIMTPLGYLFCGRDAMTLGREIEAHRA
jgi:hypothetical protein